MIEADEGLVRSLPSDQHPDLAGLPLRLAGVGWDNVLWRLGDDLLVRLPRRRLAAPLAANEHRWPPALAPRLPPAGAGPGPDRAAGRRTAGARLGSPLRPAPDQDRG